MQHEENPTGEEFVSRTWQPWLSVITNQWRYSDAEKRWFLDQLAKVPADAGIAGAFTTQVLTTLRQQGHDVDDFLQHMRFSKAPSKFKHMPMNHYILSTVEAAHRMGEGTSLASDLEHVKGTFTNSLFAALIRQTLPGFTGSMRVGEILRLTAKALSGVLYKGGRYEVSPRPTGWTLDLIGDQNFLGRFLYADAFYELTGGTRGPVTKVSFEEVEPGHCQLHFVVPNESRPKA